MDKQAQTLKEVQASIHAIDGQRKMADLTDAEREALELTAVALRDAERVALAAIQKQVIKDLEEKTAALKEQAKTIRAKVTQINKMPNVIESITSVIKLAVKIVAAIAKW
ncbi:MAG: hypothetical protein LBE56_09050 [Tannerella sp.]|jgi:hypothetical protein|nr:hypothetical protein [Tannerella sp.]